MPFDDSPRVLEVAGRRLLVRGAALGEIFALRHAELRPGLPGATAEFAADDAPTTRHFGVFVSAGDGQGDRGVAVACASFMVQPHDGAAAYQLRGMATCADLVRHGIGGALLRHALAVLAARDQARFFWCNARLAAVPFYRRMGWRVASDRFDIPSVGPHHVMTFRAAREPG